MIQRKYLILLAMSGLVVALDQLTKFLVISRLRLSEGQSIIEGFFHITRVHNKGAAFGIFTTLPEHIREPFLFALPTLTLAIILVIFTRVRGEQLATIYALAMIVGGALGNIADRLRLGYVVDFLDFHWKNSYHFPAFNIADAGISVGVTLLLFGMLFDRESVSTAQEPS